MLSTRRAFIHFGLMAGRVLRRYWSRARPIRMKIMNASSQLGERLGIDWLTYNPLVFFYYHEHAVADAPTVARTFEEVFPEAKRFVDAGAGSGPINNRYRGFLWRQHPVFPQQCLRGPPRT
jgi:hypothetical protein